MLYPDFINSYFQVIILLYLSLPNEVGRLIVFAPLVLISYFFYFFFFPPKFCLNKFLVTSVPIVLKLWDMVDMGV